MRKHRLGIGLFVALVCLAAITGVLWYAFFGKAARREPDGVLASAGRAQERVESCGSAADEAEFFCRTRVPA